MAKKERLGLQWWLWLIWQRHFRAFAWIIFLAIVIASLAAIVFSPFPCNLVALILLMAAIYLFSRDIRKYNKLCESQ